MMKMLLLLLCCIPWIGRAQFNDTINYFLKHSSTGIINRTNDRNSFVLNNALRFSVYKKNVSINTNNTWVYGEQQDIVSNNDFASTLDFDLFKTKRHLYYWGLLHYEKSLSLKVDDRFQGGLGVGYYLIDREDFVIQISDGILYEYSDLYAQEGLEDEEYDTYRNSLRLKFRFVFWNSVTLDGVDFIQHSLSDRKDYIVRSTTNLSVKVYKWLGFTIAVNYNKLNATRRENFLLNYGLTIEKYF
jgi:hypothetical protein